MAGRSPICCIQIQPPAHPPRWCWNRWWGGTAIYVSPAKPFALHSINLVGWTCMSNPPAGSVTSDDRKRLDSGSPDRIEFTVQVPEQALEAHRGAPRDLRIRGEVQLNHFRSEPLVFAVAPCLSWLVARNGSESACCTLLHGWSGGSQPCKLITDAPNVAGHGISSLQRRCPATQGLDASRTQTQGGAVRSRAHRLRIDCTGGVEPTDIGAHQAGFSGRVS